LNIKAVLFDLDDTLLWDDRSVMESFEAVCAYASAITSVDSQVLEAAVRSHARYLYESFDTFPFTQRIGINPFEALWANFQDDYDANFHQLRELAPSYRKEAWTRGLMELGIRDEQLGEELSRRFGEERRARPYVYDDTFSVLDKLKGQYALLLLTNGSPDLQKEKLAGVTELASYFDYIVISGAFGKGKPAPEIFRHSMGLLGITAEEGVMVGDKLTTDILGANTVGMRSVWMNRHHIARTDEIVPFATIQNLTELIPLLERWNR